MEFDEDLHNLLALINTLRRGPDSEDLSGLEARIDARYRASHRLAVYGSLAPGGPNHGIVEDLDGEWAVGRVRGELHSRGWEGTMGFPSFRWTPGGEPIDVWLLTSAQLPDRWEALDRFEGPSYQRSLVPIETESGLTVTNIYELHTRLRDLG